MNYINTTEQQILKYYYDHIPEIDNNLSFISDQGKAIYKALVQVSDQENKLELTLIYKYAVLDYPKLKEFELDFLKDFPYEVENLKQYKSDLNKLVLQEDIQDGVLNKLNVAIAKKRISTEELSDLYDDLGRELDKLSPVSEIEILANEVNEYDEYKKILDDRLSGKSYPSGCRVLDSYLYNGSLYPGEISILLGFTGSAKSSYMNYLVEQRRIQQLPTLHIQLEMSETAMLDSKMALRLREDKEMFHLRDEDVREDHYQYLLDKIEKRYPRAKRNKRYWSFNTTTMNIYKLKKLILKVKRLMGLKPTDYIWVGIDLLTMVDEFNVGSGSKADCYERAMNMLHNLVKELNIHVTGVVQQNRPKDKVRVHDIEDLESLRPTIETVKNGHAIAERSRVVISLFRKKYFAEQYLEDNPETEILDDLLEAKIIKANLGGLSETFKYLFHPESGQLFYYVEEKEEEENGEDTK